MLENGVFVFHAQFVANLGKLYYAMVETCFASVVLAFGEFCFVQLVNFFGKSLQ